MIKRRIVGVIGLTLLALVLAVGEAGAGKKKEPVSESVFLSGRLPVLDTVPGYPWQQTQGGVTIKLVPVPFEENVAYYKTVREKPKGLFSIGTGNAVTYLVTEEPKTYLFKPDSLTFQLHITNQMNHVLRFSGSILSFTADGKSLPVNTRTQDELLKAIILPQGSLDITLMGPQVNNDRVMDTMKTLLDTAKTITFAIYDVAIEVDAANNPTKRATFEWIFANKPKTISGTFEKTTTEQKLLPADAAAMKDQWYFK